LFKKEKDRQRRRKSGLFLSLFVAAKINICKLKKNVNGKCLKTLQFFAKFAIFNKIG